MPKRVGLFGFYWDVQVNSEGREFVWFSESDVAFVKRYCISTTCCYGALYLDTINEKL